MVSTLRQSQLNLNCKYVLVAEFNIESGPILKHQYPDPKVDHELPALAELSIPDGSHEREEDCTVLILHESKNKYGETILKYTIENGEESTGTYYMLNLVHTKFSDDLARGASVKSIAIITKLKFFSIFTPLLRLALNEYFKEAETNKTSDPLQDLYECLNAIDFSSVGKYSTVGNVLLTRINALNPTISSSRFMDIYSGKDIDDEIKKTKKGNSDHCNSIKDMKPSSGFQTVYRGQEVELKLPHTFITDDIGEFSVTSVVRSLLSNHSAIGVTHPELTPYGPKTPALLVLLNGLITGKRIVFLGYKQSAFNIVNFVLAAFSISSAGILTTYKNCCFPYTDLSKIDEIAVLNRYLLGVSNPFFKHHPEWWDILYDIDDGSITISSLICSIPSTPNITSSKFIPIDDKDATLLPLDKKLIKDINNLLNSKKNKESAAEAQIRNLVQIYYTDFFQMLHSFVLEGSLHDSEKRNSKLIKYVNCSYGYFWKDLKEKQTTLTKKKSLMLATENILKEDKHLQTLIPSVALMANGKIFNMDHILDEYAFKALDEEEIEDLYRMVTQFIHNENDLEKLSCSILKSKQRLEALAYGLFSSNNFIRSKAIELFQAIQKFSLGEYILNQLNRTFIYGLKRAQNTII